MSIGSGSAVEDRHSRPEGRKAAKNSEGGEPKHTTELRRKRASGWSVVRVAEKENRKVWVEHRQEFPMCCSRNLSKILAGFFRVSLQYPTRQKSDKKQQVQGAVFQHSRIKRRRNFFNTLRVGNTG
jgi:hypothetical protein